MEDKILISADPETGILLHKSVMSHIDSITPSDGVFSDNFSEVDSARIKAMGDDDTEVVSNIKVDMELDGQPIEGTDRTSIFANLTQKDADEFGKRLIKLRSKLRDAGGMKRGFSIKDDDGIHFCYKEGRGLLIRPYFVIEIENEEDAIKKPSESVLPVFPLDTKVKIKITYNDPDGLGFENQIEHLKIKDYHDLVDIGNTVPKFNKSSKTNRLTIESDFPGICKLRVKDNKYLCVPDRLSIRFKSNKRKK